MSPFIKQAFVVLGAALNIVGHGCAHGFPAILFAQLKTEKGPTSFTDDDISWIGSIVGVMGFTGNLLSPLLMSKIGRQKTHLATTVPVIIGWVIFLTADSVPMFILARLLHGLGIGLRTPLAAILVAEYADPKYRGAFLGTFAVSLGLGIFLSHLWGAYLSWRMTALACSSFPFLSFLIISLSPESPSWLVSKSEFGKATEAHRWLRGDDARAEQELQRVIQAQKSEMAINKEKVEFEALRRHSVKKAVKSSFSSIRLFSKVILKQHFYKPSIIAISVLMIFEFGGAHFVPTYGNQILQAVLNRKSPLDVAWQLTVIDILRTLCAFIAIFLLKYSKRRTLLFSSGVLTVLTMLSISTLIYLRKAGFLSQPLFTDVVPMALMVFYTVSFCLGPIPLTWVILGEIFPLSHRSMGSTLSSSFLSPAFIISMKTAPHLYSSIGVEGAFLIYSAILSISLLIIFALLPETKDKTLQDIEDSFKGRIKVDPNAESKLVEEVKNAMIRSNMNCEKT